MSLRRSLSPLIALLVVAASAAGVGHTLAAQDSTTGVALAAKIKATKQADDGSGVRYGFQIGSGLGVFQDVQVPVNSLDGVRGDGKTAGEESANHIGIPLSAGLTATAGQAERLRYDATIDYLTMRATTGPAETQSSSYARTNIVAGARYAFGNGAWRPTLAGHGILRRSSFKNVSSGHFVNAALARVAIGLWHESLTLAAYAGYAPYASFGYDAGTGGLGKPFDSGTVSLGELGLLYSHKLDDAVWLDLGVEQEIVRASVGRVQDYNGFGLNVTPAPERRYDLVTTTARIGVRKQF